MSTEEMQDLIKRINEEPSVLFLGQNYLTNDPYDRYILELKAMLKIEDESIHSFSSLYKKLEQSCENPKDSMKSIRKLASAMCSMSSSYLRVTWLKKILHWRWNLVYTSSPDGIIYQNYSADRISDPTASYRTEYAQKAILILLNYLEAAMKMRILIFPLHGKTALYQVCSPMISA